MTATETHTEARRASALALSRDVVPRLAERATAYEERRPFPEARFADLRAAGTTGPMAPVRLASGSRLSRTPTACRPTGTAYRITGRAAHVDAYLVTARDSEVPRW